MMAVIAANDIGHTFVKSMAVISGEERRVFFESVLGEPQPLLGQANGYLQIETTEGNWFVGQAALEQSKNQIWGQSSDWAFTPEYRALHFLAISELISSATHEIEVYLATGLPRADWRNRDALKKSLIGQHTIKRSGRRGLVINIKDVYPVVQGVSSLAGFGKADPNLTVAYLGLGGRNRVFATQKGNKPISDLCGSTEGGFLSVVDDFSKKVFQLTGRQLKLHEAIQAMIDGQVRSKGKPYDVSRIRDEATEPYIRSTKSHIAQVWGDTTLIDELQIGGGGALAVGQIIVRDYEQARLASDPQWTEVRGLLDIGRSYFSGKI